MEKQSLLTQLGEARHTYTVLEERLQRHDAELAQERNDNQAHREQLEKLRLDRDQIQEQLSQNQTEKQSLLVQSGQFGLDLCRLKEGSSALREGWLKKRGTKCFNRRGSVGQGTRPARGRTL